MSLPHFGSVHTGSRASNATAKRRPFRRPRSATAIDGSRAGTALTVGDPFNPKQKFRKRELVFLKALRRRPDLKDAEVRLAEELFDRIDIKRGDAWASQTTIARDLGWEVGKVKRIVGALKRKGLITTRQDRRPRAGEYFTNSYAFVWKEEYQAICKAPPAPGIKSEPREPQGKDDRRKDVAVRPESPDSPGRNPETPPRSKSEPQKSFSSRSTSFSRSPEPLGTPSREAQGRDAPDEQLDSLFDRPAEQSKPDRGEAEAPSAPRARTREELDAVIAELRANGDLERARRAPLEAETRRPELAEAARANRSKRERIRSFLTDAIGREPAPADVLRLLRASPADPSGDRLLATWTAKRKPGRRYGFPWFLAVAQEHHGRIRPGAIQ